MFTRCVNLKSLVDLYTFVSSGGDVLCFQSEVKSVTTLCSDTHLDITSRFTYSVLSLSQHKDRGRRRCRGCRRRRGGCGSWRSRGG